MRAFSRPRRLPATAEITGIAELPRCPGAVVEGDLASVWEAEARFEGDSLTRVLIGGLPLDAKKLGLPADRSLPHTCHPHVSSLLPHFTSEVGKSMHLNVGRCQEPSLGRQ